MSSRPLGPKACHDDRGSEDGARADPTFQPEARHVGGVGTAKSGGGGVRGVAAVLEAGVGARMDQDIFNAGVDSGDEGHNVSPFGDVRATGAKDFVSGNVVVAGIRTTRGSSASEIATGAALAGDDKGARDADCSSMAPEPDRLPLLAPLWAPPADSGAECCRNWKDLRATTGDDDAAGALPDLEGLCNKSLLGCDGGLLDAILWSCCSSRSRIETQRCCWCCCECSCCSCCWGCCCFSVAGGTTALDPEKPSRFQGLLIAFGPAVPGRCAM